MQYLIKEWPNKMATLMTEDGVVLWTFSNVKEAEKVWKDWCSLKIKIIRMLIMLLLIYY